MAGGGSIAQRSYRFRALIIILTGVLGFVLGALYLSVEQMEVTSVVVVTGPAEVGPGAPVAIRVAALARRGHESFSVRVLGGAWRPAGAVEAAGDGGGAPRPLELAVDGTRPAVVRFRVPDGAPDGLAGTASLALSLRVIGAPDGDHERTVAVPFTIAPAVDVAVHTPGPAETVAADALRVSLLPEVRVLSWRFDGPVFVRVTDAAGAPVAATVSLRIGKDEVRSGTTGPLGLTSFPIRADRPRYQLHARATAGDRHGEAEEDLRPVPRGRRLRLLPRVVPPGGRYRLEVTALEAKETLHCDVVADGRARGAFTLDVGRGAAAVERTAPATPGRYAIQCAPHYRTPGSGFTSAALVVARGADPVAALLDAVEPRDGADARWLAAARARQESVDDATRERLADYLAARLTPDYAPSAHLASTLEGDRASLAAERAAVRGKLLLALGIALAALLVWALVVVGAHLRDARRQSAAMAALLDEPDDGGGASGAAELRDLDPDAPLPPPPTATSFVRARSVVQYAVIAVLLVVNLVALLWLLGNVIR